MGFQMPARTKFKFGFSETAKKILDYYSQGLRQVEIGPLVELGRAQMSKSVRLYLTAHGKTPDSGIPEIRNKAIDLVKQLDADEISLHNADTELTAFIRRVTGKEKTTYRRSASVANPDLQLAGYQRATANLEGICYGLDSLPETVHASIPLADLEDIERRLAACRRTIEKRINIIRKVRNAEA